MMDIRKIKAIEQRNKHRILAHFPEITDQCGIYIMTREEDGFKYAYVGQAQRLLSRIVDHLNGYQHIDLSIKKHGLRSEKNPTGWRIRSCVCKKSELDNMEKKYIHLCANTGYQMRNKTSGGQGKGKIGIADNRPSKGYHDGLRQGYLNASRDVGKLFEKNLIFTFQGEKTNKNKEKAMAKFNEFLKGERA